MSDKQFVKVGPHQRAFPKRRFAEDKTPAFAGGGVKPGDKVTGIAPVLSETVKVDASKPPVSEAQNGIDWKQVALAGGAGVGGLGILPAALGSILGQYLRNKKDKKKAAATAAAAPKADLYSNAPAEASSVTFGTGASAGTDEGPPTLRRTGFNDPSQDEGGPEYGDALVGVPSPKNASEDDEYGMAEGGRVSPRSRRPRSGMGGGAGAGTSSLMAGPPPSGPVINDRMGQMQGPPSGGPPPPAGLTPEQQTQWAKMNAPAKAWGPNMMDSLMAIPGAGLNPSGPGMPSGGPPPGPPPGAMGPAGGRMGPPPQGPPPGPPPAAMAGPPPPGPAGMMGPMAGGPPPGPPPGAMGPMAGRRPPGPPPGPPPGGPPPDPAVVAQLMQAIQAQQGGGAPPAMADGGEVPAYKKGGKVVEDTEGNSPRAKGDRVRQYGDVGKPAEELPPMKKAKGGKVKHRAPFGSGKKKKAPPVPPAPMVTDDDMGTAPHPLGAAPPVAAPTAAPPVLPGMKKGGACEKMAAGGVAKLRKHFPKVKKMATGGGVRGCGAAKKGKGFSGVY